MQNTDYTPTGRTAIFALAFRPFFLLGAAYAAFVVLAWAAFHVGWFEPPTYFEAPAWHAHEMLYGFVAAILAGFLLTAAKNWTNSRGVHGYTLFWLTALWCVGRLAMVGVLPLPNYAIATVDLLFLPCTALLLGNTLSLGGKKINFAFVFWLYVLSVGNLMMHFEALEISVDTARPGYLLAVDTVVMFLILMGRRVIPMFTRNAVQGISVSSSPILGHIQFGSAVLYLIFDQIRETSPATAILCATAGLSTILLMLSWNSLKTFRYPIVAVLHIGYFFIGAGLLTRGLSLSLMPMPISVSIHLLTAGAIGTLIIGMTSRVSLGHTGRSIIASRLTTIAYALVVMGSLVRVLAPVNLPSLYVEGLLTAAVLWASGFILFVIEYFPILTTKRVDGREG